jgi:hypothetical protein
VIIAHVAMEPNPKIVRATQEYTQVLWQGVLRECLHRQIHIRTLRAYLSCGEALSGMVKS